MTSGAFANNQGPRASILSSYDMQVPALSVAPSCAYPGCCAASNRTECELTPVIASVNKLAGDPMVSLCDAHRGKYCIVCGRLEIVTPGGVSHFRGANSAGGRNLGLEGTAPPENLKVGVCVRHAGKRSIAGAAEMPKGKYTKENVASESSPHYGPLARITTHWHAKDVFSVFSSQQQVSILMQELGKCRKTMACMASALDHLKYTTQQQLQVKHLEVVEQKNIRCELQQQVRVNVLKWGPRKPCRLMSWTS